MQTLPEAAIALFRLHIERHGDIIIDDSNRAPYRELERAGLMVLGNSYRDGPGTVYVVSKLGFERKAELRGGIVPERQHQPCRRVT
jgi:hypothetical protein